MSYQIVPGSNQAADAAQVSAQSQEKVPPVYTVLDRLIYVLVFAISLAGLVVYKATDGAATACLFGAVMSVVSLSNHTNLQTVTGTLGGLIGLGGTNKAA